MFNILNLKITSLKKKKETKILLLQKWRRSKVTIREKVKTLAMVMPCKSDNLAKVTPCKSVARAFLPSIRITSTVTIWIHVWGQIAFSPQSFFQSRVVINEFH